MKKLLLLVLLCGSFGAMGQTTPFKGANTLVVTLPDSGVVAWQQAAAILDRAGYTVGEANKDLLQLTTQRRQLGSSGVYTDLSGTVTGRTVKLRGRFLVDGVSREASSITYKGQKGSPYMRAWEELQRVAALLPGASVAYRQE